MDIKTSNTYLPSGAVAADRGIPSTLQKAAGSAAGTAGAAATAATDASGPAEPPVHAGRVEQAVKTINASLQGVEFAIDSDSHRTVVKVVDQETKQVLRQMPTQEALEIAKSLDRMQGLLIKQEA